MILRSLHTIFNDLSDEAIIAIRNGQPLFFSKFRNDVARIAAISNIERTTLICEDSYHFLVGLFGLLHAGAEVVIPANKTLQAFDKVITDKDITTAKTAKFDFQPLNPEKPCVHFYTSGSTGEPKCISKSLGQLQRELIILEDHFSLNSANVFATVPHHHFYGFIFRLLWPFVSHRPFDTQNYGPWEQLLSALHTPTILISSPAHLSRLAGIPELTAKSQPLVIFSAGAPLPFNALPNIQNILGSLPHEIFGSTETGAIATRQQFQEQQPWQTLPGIKVKQDSEQRMLLHSPYVPSEWFPSEDMIEMTPEGFHFLGRADSIVKVEGRRISLTRIEQCLCKLDIVQDAATILLPGDIERLASVVVLNESGKDQLQSLGKFRFGKLLRKQLEDTLELYEMPRMWRYAETIPSHGIGKRRAADLYALFGK